MREFELDALEYTSLSRVLLLVEHNATLFQVWQFSAFNDSHLPWSVVLACGIAVDSSISKACDQGYLWQGPTSQHSHDDDLSFQLPDGVILPVKLNSCFKLQRTWCVPYRNLIEVLYYCNSISETLAFQKKAQKSRSLHESECLMKAQEDRAIHDIEKRLNESKIRTQEGMVNEGIALDVDAERARVDKVVSYKENIVVGPSLENNTLTEVHQSNNDTFENMFALEIQNHGKHEVENCTKANHEAQQANVSLTKELEINKKKEKHFAKETTNESEYCKKIKLLNKEILNLKS
ncbi:hypothetical protein Tco_0226211 [Tanacetum coccineum]